MSSRIYLFLVFLVLLHCFAQAIPVTEEPQLLTTKDYAEFSETADLWELLDFIMKLCKELLADDLENLNETEILKDVMSWRTESLELASELFMKMYTSQFRIFAVKLIEIFEGSENRAPIEIHKNEIRADLEKYLAKEASPYILSCLNVWKRRSLRQKRYHALRDCLQNNLETVDPLISDELRQRFRQLALFLRLRQNEGRKYVRIDNELLEIDPILLHGLSEMILNNGQDLLYAYTELQDRNNKCFIDHMMTEHGSKWDIIVSGLHRIVPTIGNAVRTCVNAYYGKSESLDVDTLAQRCVVVNNVVHCSVCTSNRTFYLYDPMEQPTETMTISNIDLDIF